MSDPNDTPDAIPAEPTAPAPEASTETNAAPADAATADAPDANPPLETATPAPVEASEVSPENAGVEPEADAGDGESSEADSGSAEAASDEDDGEGEGGKKKKRRRRKKKKKPEGDPEKTAAHVPFLKYFEGRAGKTHAFEAGEVVAGRVTAVSDTTIYVDLFGKATAVADIYEPREVAPLPEPVKAETPPTEVESPTGAEGEAPTATETPTVAEGDAPIATEAHATDADAVEAAKADDTASAAMPEPVAAEVAEAPADVIPADASTDASPADASTVDALGEATPSAETPVEPATPPVAAAAPTHDDDDAHDDHDDHAEIDEDAEREEDDDHTSAGFLASVEDDQPPPEPPELGSIFRGRVASVAESGHIVLINRIIDRPAAKAEIASAREKRLRVRGLVYGFNRGGFDVMVHGVRAFCPARAMWLSPIDDPESFLGQKLEFSLPPLKGGGRSIIVSRRSILERELRRAARERMKKLKIGERLPGVVLDVRDYGVIVDIGGGVDGLVHQSEVSWQRGVRMSDVVKQGEPVEVEVLRVQPATRKDRFGKLSLSIRRCLPDPWDEAKELLSEGTYRSGRVVRTAEFGAFVELVPGVEGLLHISELGGRDLRHANQVLKEGDMIDVMIDRVDRKARRVGLSLLSEADKKAIEAGEFDPEQARKLKPGAHVKVVVERVEHHGIFVHVRGVIGKRGRGYISNRDLGERDGPKRRLGTGTELDVKITGTDRDGGLRCSVKHREFDDERRAVQEYRKEASKKGFGTFGDILRAKLGGDEDSR